MLIRNSFLTILFAVFSYPAYAQELCTYTTKISAKDKLTQAGKPLMLWPNKEGALASIQIDRANFHRYQKRDTEDTTDCLFANIRERQKIAAYGAQALIPATLLEKMWKGEPVLHIQVYKDRIEIAEASSAPTAEATSAPTIPQTQSKGASLIRHEETARVLKALQKDRGLQQAFKQAFSLNPYAECAAMVADIEQGLGNGQYELAGQQLTTYAGVAAGMIFIQQHLISSGTPAPTIEEAVRKVQQGATGMPSVYDQCYKAMQPVYGAARQIR